MTAHERGCQRSHRRAFLARLGTRGSFGRRLTRSRSRWAGACLGVLLAATVGRAEEPVDFHNDIEPILRAKCVLCHGPELQHGGLRLDGQKWAAAGGHSRKIVLGGTLENNELYRRIISTDVAVRMPKNAPPLTPEERQRFALWIQQGSPWPVPVVRPPSVAESRKLQDAEPFWWKWVDRLETIVRPVQLWVLPGMFVLLFIAFIERYQDSTRRARMRAEAAGGSPPAVRWPRLLRITRSHYVNLVLIVALGAALQRLWQGPPANETLPATARRTEPDSRPDETIVRADNIYGMPPRPLRPHHPRQLVRTYYRGNCERGEALYNGGNYQTARFHLRLCDDAGNTVDVGDAVPEGGLFIDFQMVRPHGTHENFYSASTIDAVAISRQIFTNEARKPTEPLIRLEAVKPDWRWQARIPLGVPTEEQKEQWATTVYVYRGTTHEAMQTAGTFTGEFHYAILCDLRRKEGRITADSDLWMGSLFVIPVLEFPTPGKVPLDEWFDFRPIPEIVGENTTKDPKLLGLPTTPAPGAEGKRE